MKTDPGAEPPPSGPSRTARPRDAGSIVIRMTAWYAATAFLLVLVATGVLYGTVAGNLRAENRRILTDTAATLRLLLRAVPDGAALPTQSGALHHALIEVRVIAPDGRVMLQTTGMDRSVPLVGFPALLALPLGQTVIGRVQTETGQMFETLSERVRRGPAGSAVLQVAIDLSHDQRVLVSDRERLQLVLIVALGLCSAIGYAIASSGMRPVARIIAAARRMRATTLHERLDVAGLPGELQALAETFNDMLDRLEASFNQVSQFSADVAHELRTPINNLRGELEVALGRTRSAAAYRDVLGSALEECGRINRVIHSLLFLARAESAGVVPQCEGLNLDAALSAIVEFYEPAAAEAGISLVPPGPARLVAQVDRTLFQQAVGNLVANAIAHTPRGGRVSVTAAPDAPGMLQVAVTDTGCGIAAMHLPRVFDRFYRADPSRSSRSGNVGLGLAVVRSIAALHGGSVAIESTTGVGTKVILRLPLVTA